MILILNQDDLVLLGKRKNAFSSGEYGIPSGHMELGETFLQAAIREIKEETGLDISPQQLVLFAITNYIMSDWTDQYVTFDFILRIDEEKVQVTTVEPDKCEGWEWHSLNSLPRPLHYPAEKTITQYQKYLEKEEVILS